MWIAMLAGCTQGTPAADGVPTELVVAEPAALSIGEATEIPLCDGGDIEACFRLASCYAFGHGGTTVDFAKARRWLEHSCEGQYPSGCNDLGAMHAEGKGVPVDAAKAAELYGKACAMKDGMGCSNLAAFRADGTGGPKDLAQAEVLYNQACEYGDEFGCRDLAMAYATLDGFTHDPAKAIAILSRQCEAERGQSCADLGYLHLRGIGVPASREQGGAYLQKACGFGYQRACGFE